MQVQDHTTLLHGREDRVEWFIRNHSRGGVCGNTSGVYKFSRVRSFSYEYSRWSLKTPVK